MLLQWQWRVELNRVLYAYKLCRMVIKSKTNIAFNFQYYSVVEIVGVLYYLQKQCQTFNWFSWLCWCIVCFTWPRTKRTSRYNVPHCHRNLFQFIDEWRISYWNQSDEKRFLPPVSGVGFGYIHIQNGWIEYHRSNSFLWPMELFRLNKFNVCSGLSISPLCACCSASVIGTFIRNRGWKDPSPLFTCSEAIVVAFERHYSNNVYN